MYVVMAFLLSAVAVVGAVRLIGLARTNAGLEIVYGDRVIPFKQLKQIADAYAVSVIDAANEEGIGSERPSGQWAEWS